MDELRYQLDLLKALNQKLSGREKMYRLICDMVSDVFLYCSFDKNEIVTVGHWRDFFRFRIGEPRDLSLFFDEVEEAYILPLRNLLFLEKSNQSREKLECCLKDGRTWLRFEALVTYGEGGEPDQKVISISNITRAKSNHEELKYMAYYDSLTGLYNRNYFVVRLGELLKRAKEEHNIVSVLFIDIDDFRKINDGMGILAGDEVVQQFGQFLGGFAGERIIVCRMNSDVYCMAVYDPCGADSVESIYRAIRERTSQSFILSNGAELTISVSVGVAEYPEAAESALELISCAEIVTFRIKEQGKAALQYFNEPVLQAFLQNVEIEAKLKKAAVQDTFTMRFQPQYYAENGRLRGVEALIRWDYEKDRKLSPAVFIPIAEKSGIIVRIGRWVIEESFRCFSKWKESYDYPMTISLNISAIQYRHCDFVNELTDAAEKYRVKPEEVELEITEDVFSGNLQELKERLDVLHEYGFRIALDNFGMNFDFLARLKKLPVTALKIDRSFIAAIEADSASPDGLVPDKTGKDEFARIILGSAMDIVHKLGYESVAKGVETQAQLAFAKEIGCDLMQGYLLGRPMTAQEIDKLLISLL